MTRSMSRGETQDCSVVHRDTVDPDDAKHWPAPWMVQGLNHPDADQAFFKTEEEACLFQRSWREFRGLDPLTGSLVASAPVDEAVCLIEEVTDAERCKERCRLRLENLEIRMVGLRREAGDVAYRLNETEEEIMEKLNLLAKSIRAAAVAQVEKES